MPRSLALLAALSAGVLCSPAGAVSFGQNYTIVDDFEWKLRSTEHFDVYYYDGSAPLVPQTAKILEEAYARVSRVLDISISTTAAAAKKSSYPVWTRRAFFLYACPNDFQQSNVARTGEGTGGVTEPFKDRFMAYNDGTMDWLREVITHEFTHIMQFYTLIDGPFKSGRVLKSEIYPLWMIEGMAGYTTKFIEETLEEVTVRDAATSGGLLPLIKLEHFGHLKPHQVTLAYKEGAAAMEFLDEQFGPKKVAQFLKIFETRYETSTALGGIVGLDAWQFDKKFREYLEAKYGRVVRKEGLHEPWFYGERMTEPDGIPQQNTSPVFSPDGKRMYYFTTRTGHPPQIYQMDLATGVSRRLVSIGDARTDFVSLGNFANLSRVLSLSPDGNTLVFSGTKTHRDALYFYDIKGGRLERRELPGFMAVNQPAFSPDGRKVAFSGMKQSATDIYLYDRASRGVERMTDDPQDDEMPVFTPDGRALVYSSEVLDAATGYAEGRRLYRLELEDRSVSGLESVSENARDPVVSPDGSKVLFIREGGGFSEICELDLASRKVYRLTKSIGGMFTPSYVGADIAFAALRRGDIHLYRGPRAGFPMEEITGERPELDEAAKSMLPGMGGVRSSSATVTLSAERPYRFSFSTDLILPALLFSSPGGFFMTAYWQGSDLLGNHQVSTLASYSSNQSLFDYQTQYAYVRRRPQFFAGAQGRGQRDLYNSDLSVNYNEAYHAQFAGVQYPFDRYHRVEGAFSTVTDRVVYPGGEFPRQDLETRVLSGSFVRDTVNGRYLAATRGDRFAVSGAQAMRALGGNQRLNTVLVEAHKFIETGSQSAIALRAMGIESFGPDRNAFILGGVGGVRGYEHTTSANFGNRLAVLNTEWRFPLVSNLNYHLWWFFPDFYFKAVFGTIFVDNGFVWNSAGEVSRTHWNDMRDSVGVGIRIFTFVLQDFPFLVSMDYARQTTSRNAGIFYVYLGTPF